MKRNKVPAKEEEIFAQSGSVDVRKGRCGKVPPPGGGERKKKKEMSLCQLWFGSIGGSMRFVSQGTGVVFEWCERDV